MYQKIQYVCWQCPRVHKFPGLLETNLTKSVLAIACPSIGFVQEDTTRTCHVMVLLIKPAKSTFAVIWTIPRITKLVFNSYIFIWLVVSTPLKNISQLGWLFPIYGKYWKVTKFMFQTTNQPVIVIRMYSGGFGTWSFRWAHPRNHKENRHSYKWTNL